MTVTHTSAGFTGTVDQVAWANMMSMAAPRFRVGSATDWAVSVSGSTARTINIAAGAGYSCGVRDSTTSADTVAFATNGGGSSRYDALVASYVWGTPGVTFKAITGTTSPPAVNTTTTVNNAQINRIPGVQYDALLAVVQIRPSVGILSSGDLFDMRPYGGLSGPVMLPNSTYLSIVDGRPGTEVYAVDTKFMWLTLDGSTWTWPPEAQGELGRTEYTTTGTGVVLANTLTGLPSLNVTTSYIPANRRIEARLSGTVAADVAPSAYTFLLYQGAVGTGQFAQQGVQVSTTVGQGFSIALVVNTATALTNQLWTVAGRRETGSGTFSFFARTGTEGPVQYSIRDLGAV